jgi:hypothetical protein
MSGAKFGTDYCNMMLLRHPLAVGGFYWSVNTCFSIVILIFGLLLYKDTDGGDSDLEGNSPRSNYPDAIPYEVVHYYAKGIIGTWLISVFTFYKQCRKDCRRTFYKLQTASQFTKEKWDWQLENASSFPSLAEAHEAGLMHLTLLQPRLFAHFGSEVSHWINENWDTWLGVTQRKNFNRQLITKELLMRIPVQFLTGDQQAEIKYKSD